MFAEVYLWASAVFCARPSLQRNSIGTATKMRNPKLVGSLSMHQRSVSLPFHRKPTGTRTKMDNPKLVGGLSMSFQSSHFPNFPNEFQCCHLRPVCTHWALLSVDMLPKIAHACSFMGLEKGLDLAQQNGLVIWASNVSLWDLGCEDGIHGSNVARISECISCHHLVRAPITLLDIQSKVAIACQCHSFPEIISRCFCQHFFIFWGPIFGSHFWAPFLVPLTLTILRENLTGARDCRFKNGPPFWRPKN